MTPLCWAPKECTDLNLSHGNTGAICVIWLQMPLLNTWCCWLNYCTVQMVAREHILCCPCRSSHLVWGAMCVTLCACVCVGQQHLPTPPVPLAPPTALSRFIICSPALRCSGTSWPLWIHLLLLFSTDNWLEQWNACVPLAFETQHPVYFPEVSFLLSFPLSYPLSPLNFSLSLLSCQLVSPHP